MLEGLIIYFYFSWNLPFNPPPYCPHLSEKGELQNAESFFKRECTPIGFESAWFDEKEDCEKVMRQMIKQHPSWVIFPKCFKNGRRIENGQWITYGVRE